MGTRRYVEARTVACASGESPRLAARAVAAALVALACAVGLAWSNGENGRLSTTVIGSLEPGGEPRLAVRWDGPAGALLEVWVDLDGDGQPGPGELVVDGEPLEPGIEVVELEIPADAFLVSDPKLWVHARRAEAGAPQRPPEEHAGSSTRDDCGWQPGFHVTDLDNEVLSMAVFDDGTGPNLYVGGYFEAANDVVVNGIARWDGETWSALSGPSGTGMGDHDNEVFALAVFDDGLGPALYAGGYFQTAGGVQVKDLEEGETALTTFELGDWVWYLHLCAVDNLGQWGAVVSSGPYPICPLFADDYESGDTSAWSVTVP